MYTLCKFKESEPGECDIEHCSEAALAAAIVEWFNENPDGRIEVTRD